jgi:hypothetical protein
MSVLDRFLKKLGVSSYNDLNEEERKTFRDWENALQGRRLTDEDVKVFIETEKERCTTAILNPEVSKEVDTFYKMELDLLRRIENFLNSPKLEKELLEKQIEAQL